jgi:hypothetical protein
MSHFNVLVIGPDPESQMIPFQENNMGDCPEEYLTFHSIEEEYRDKYEKESVEKVVMTDGRLLNTWDKEFDVLGEHIFDKKTVIPEHLKRRIVPYRELFPTFEAYMAEWCGHKERDLKIGEYGYWENPNAKWDFYRLGGRWRGFFKLKHPNADAVLSEKGWDSPEKEMYGRCDQATKGLIDFEGMEDEAGEKARQRYENVERLFGGFIPTLQYKWKDIIDGEEFKDLDIEAKRKLYHDQNAAVIHAAAKKRAFDKDPSLSKEDCDLLIWMELDDYQISKEEYIQAARNHSGVTFAVVMDDKFFESGRMEYWGIVFDEKEEGEWNNKFQTLISGLLDDTLLTIYDCHI